MDDEKYHDFFNNLPNSYDVSMYVNQFLNQLNIMYKNCHYFTTTTTTTIMIIVTTFL